MKPMFEMKQIFIQQQRSNTYNNKNIVYIYEFHNKNQSNQMNYIINLNTINLYRKHVFIRIKGLLINSKDL